MLENPYANTYDHKRCVPTIRGYKLTTQVVEMPQHMVALQKAQSIRLARCQLKRDVASGRITVADVLMNSQKCTENMTVFELLMSQQRWGRTRVKKLLATLPITESKTIGSLTDRQREAIIRSLA